LWIGQLGQDAGAFLHDLLLQRTRRLDVHGGAGLVGVLDVGEAEGTAAVHVLLELGDSRSCVVLGAELDDTGATRATVGLVLNLRALDLADGGEQLDQILVAGAPGKVANVDNGRRVHARGGEVGERVRGSGRSGRGSAVTSSTRRRASVATARSTVSALRAAVTATAVATSEPATTSKARARTESTTASKASVESSTTIAASEAAATAEATTATEASSAGKAVFTDLEETAGPVVAVELLNGVLGVFRSLEGDDTRALGSSIRSHVNVGADD
jgi:type IV secretory pathway VirJ component